MSESTRPFVGVKMMANRMHLPIAAYRDAPVLAATRASMRTDLLAAIGDLEVVGGFMDGPPLFGKFVETKDGWLDMESTEDEANFVILTCQVMCASH